MIDNIFMVLAVLYVVDCIICWQWPGAYEDLIGKKFWLRVIPYIGIYTLIKHFFRR